MPWMGILLFQHGMPSSLSEDTKQARCGLGSQLTRVSESNLFPFIRSKMYKIEVRAYLKSQLHFVRCFRLTINR